MTYEEIAEGKTEAEISEEFLKKYRELCFLYHRDFQVKPPEIVILQFNKPPEQK